MSEPKPGYLTTEFWSTMFVHALAAVITLLDLVNVHWSHVSAVQGAIPVVALAISSILQAGYHDKRVAVKMDNAAQEARKYIAEVQSGLHDVEPQLVTATQTINSPWVSAAAGTVSGGAAAVELAKTVLSDANKIAEAAGATATPEGDAAP